MRTKDLNDIARRLADICGELSGVRLYSEPVPPESLRALSRIVLLAKDIPVLCIPLRPQPDDDAQAGDVNAFGLEQL